MQDYIHQEIKDLEKDILQIEDRIIEFLGLNYDDDLAKTGKMLLEKNINGAGVLSRHGNIIGILSKTDIVKAVAFLK